MKFSIIIPVYKTEKYLSKCIESVLSQTYQNFEMIIINDGSPDNSNLILDKYSNNSKIKIINQSNHGVSYSRNIGVQRANGDYILFLDSDDYYERNLLKNLNNYIENEDILKFSYVTLKDNIKEKVDTITFKNSTGKEALIKIIESKTMFDLACIYAFKTTYMKKYKFEENRRHEDFGLIPIMIFYANKVSSIDYPGYMYNKNSEESLTNYTSDEKEYKKALDVLYFFKKIKNTETDKYLLSFYSNGAILKIKSLKGKYKRNYIKDLRKEKVIDYILNNSFKRRVKKIILKVRYLL